MSAPPRRRFLAGLSAAGVATPALLFPGCLWAKVQEEGVAEITPEIVLDAARVAGLTVTRDQAEAMVEEVEETPPDTRSSAALPWETRCHSPFTSTPE